MRLRMNRIFLFIAITFTVTLNGQSTVENINWELVATGFSFPEGPAWHKNGNLYLSNCHGGWLAKISENKVDTLLSASDTTFIKTNGIVVGNSGDLFVCEYGKGKIIKITNDGEVTTLLDGYKGKSFNRPNDLTFDEKGNLYFTDPKDYRAEKDEGRVFYYNFSDNSLKLVVDGLDFPNGIAISPITKKLYLSESGQNRVLEFEKTEDGNLINKRTFIELKGGDPDGLDFDVLGNLYVAHFGSGTLYIVSQKGQILQEIKTPGKQPSNLEFGGKDLRTIYLTEDENNSVYKIRVRTKGFKILNSAIN